MIEAKISKFVDNMFKKESQPTSVTIKIVYLSLSYFGRHTENLKKILVFLLQKYFNNISFNIFLVNLFKIVYCLVTRIDYQAA